MTYDEYKKIGEQVGHLLEIKNDGYGGLTIENIIKQLAGRMKHFEESQGGVLLKPIVECGFSVRSLGCLRRAGVETVADLVRFHKIDLFKLRNLGRKSLREICDFVEDNGLELGMEL